MRSLSVRESAAVRAIALVLVSGAVGGCTTSLSSQPDKLGAGAPTNGIPYRLPAAQFNVAVTWTLKACNAAPKGADNGTVEYAASAVFSSKVVEGESMVIDYQHLTNSFKTGELKVEYHDKTMLLKTINATIEGHEAEATGEALKLGFTAARLAMGLPAIAAGGGGRALAGERIPCTDQAYDALKALEDVTARIEAIPDEAKTATDRMAVLRARLIGDSLTDDDKQELEKLQGQADALAERLADLTEVKAQLEEQLTFSKTLKFPPNASAKSATLVVDQKDLAKWFGSLLRPSQAAKAWADVEQARAKEADLFTVVATLSPLSTEATCDQNSCGALGEAAGGVVFRQPVQAGLVVRAQSNAKPLLDETVSVPQFGRLRVLPLRSRWGEKNTLSASFAADGLPTMVEYKSLNARGLAALKVANEGSAGLLALMGQIDAAKTAEGVAAKAKAEAATKAELDGVNNQVALLEAQTKLQKLQQPGSPDLDTLEAQLAILRLKKEQSDLETAIAKNSKAADTDDE